MHELCLAEQKGILSLQTKVHLRSNALSKHDARLRSSWDLTQSSVVSSAELALNAFEPPVTMEARM